jgi:hypothetical protein
VPNLRSEDETHGLTPKIVLLYEDTGDTIRQLDKLTGEREWEEE